MYPIASRILCVLAFSLTMSPAAQAQSMPAADPAASIAPTPEIPDIAPLTAPVNSSATPAISGTSQDSASGAPAATAASPSLLVPNFLFGSLQRTVDEFTMINDNNRVSFHKPMIMLPASCGNRSQSDEREYVRSEKRR